MPKFRAIIFDVDNTLVDYYDSKIQAAKAALRAMEKNGLEKKENNFGRLFSLYYKYGFESRIIFQKFIRQITGKIDYKLLGSAIVAYRKARDKHLKPYSGIKSTLKKLRKKGIRLIIVSDAPKLKAWIRLSVADLQNEFDFVITSSDSKGFKKDGKSFKLALKRLGLNPKEILVLGDSGSRDITPAKKMGFKTCFALYGRAHKPLVKSDYKINRFNDLIKIVTVDLQA